MTCAGVNQPAILVEQLNVERVGSCPKCLYRGPVKANGTVRRHSARAPRVVAS